MVAGRSLTHEIRVVWKPSNQGQKGTSNMHLDMAKMQQEILLVATFSEDYTTLWYLPAVNFAPLKRRESRLSRCGLLVDGFFYHRSWGSKVWVHPARSLLMFVWINASSMANEYGMTSQATTSWILLEMTWNPLLDKWPVAATSFSLWQEMEWGCSDCKWSAALFAWRRFVHTHDFPLFRKSWFSVGNHQLSFRAHTQSCDDIWAIQHPREGHGYQCWAIERGMGNARSCCQGV